jgi:TonB-linked SusC/RagA family outer membrane protein
MKKSFTAKLWKVMKLCALQWMIALAFSGVSVAHNVGAQVLDKEISVSLSGVPFEEALQRIQDLTNVKFFYSPAQLASEGPVTMQIDGWTLGEVLEELLGARGIAFVVHEEERTITLRKGFRRKKNEQSILNKPTQRARTSPIEITGTVRDAEGQRMAGVNIVVKGTTVGTTTDAEGTYSIRASLGDILVFSFIGYTSVEVPVGTQNVVDVVLREDVTSLGEVVVNAGYWKVRKKESTGNIAKVTADEIQNQPVHNPLQALQGRVAGVFIEQHSGIPGGNFTVRIRGRNSIANGNDPLYIIDGVPYISESQAFNETSGEILAGYGTSPLSSLDPSSILSIEVLKDADATAIYGSRGANGVVLITTKRGTPGDLKVDVSFNSGGAEVGRMVKMLTTEQYLEMRREAYLNDGTVPAGYSARDLLEWDTTRYTDWQEELIGGTATIMDGQLSISGGDANTQYTFGGGYHRETTVFPSNDSYKRFTGRMNLRNASSDKRFISDVSISYSRSISDFINRDLTRTALTLPPNAPELYDDEGNLNWENSTWTNPLSYLKRTYESTSSNLISNLVLDYELLPNLRTKLSLGYTSLKTESSNLIPSGSWNPEWLIPNSAYFSNSSFETWIVEPQLSWEKTFRSGLLDLVIGSTLQDQTTNGSSQYGEGFASEALMRDIAAAPLALFENNEYRKYRYGAFFARIRYAHRGKYIINLTGRRDGSSRFGHDNRFANFGAVGLAWIFSEEPFIRDNLAILSHGKLRASYGLTGNDQLGDYSYLDTYRSSGSYQGIVGLTPVRLSNPHFAWESNRKLEVGLEIGMFHSRLDLGISYFRNRSSDQLVGFSVPPTTGFTNIQGNLPAVVQNTGLELDLSTINLGNSEVTWSTSLNLTFPRNKLVQFPNLSSSPQYANTLVVGEPLSIRKLFDYLGVDPQTGIYTFADLDTDGTLSIGDRQIVRNVGQDFYGGLINTVQFKGFELSVALQFVKQTGYNPLISTWGYPGSLNNQPASVMERWREEGQESGVQRFTASYTPAAQAYFSYYGYSEEIVVDASFIRLRNASLAYTLPDKVVEKLSLRNVRFFVLGQNLLTITSYDGVDPESQQINLPPLRTVTAGFNVTF